MKKLNIEWVCRMHYEQYAINSILLKQSRLQHSDGLKIVLRELMLDISVKIFPITHLNYRVLADRTLLI